MQPEKQPQTPNPMNELEVQRAFLFAATTLLPLEQLGMVVDVCAGVFVRMCALLECRCWSHGAALCCFYFIFIFIFIFILFLFFLFLFYS